MKSDGDEQFTSGKQHQRSPAMDVVQPVRPIDVQGVGDNRHHPPHPYLTSTTKGYTQPNAVSSVIQFLSTLSNSREGFLLDPSCHEVIPLVQKLQQQLQPSEVPFEFQVLRFALEVVSNYLDSNVADLERAAYPVLMRMLVMRMFSCICE